MNDRHGEKYGTGNKKAPAFFGETSVQVLKPSPQSGKHYKCAQYDDKHLRHLSPLSGEIAFHDPLRGVIRHKCRSW